MAYPFTVPNLAPRPRLKPCPFHRATPTAPQLLQVDCTIPHYHALEATNAIKAAFPQHYLYDPTPLPQATWRIAKQCAGVEKRGDMHVFVSKE